MSITALNNIVKTKTNNRKRIGRGIGSGAGKTSGRGHKGQKSRAGVSKVKFRSGQNPIYMILPKRGFKNYCKTKYEVVNIKDALLLVEKNNIKSSEVINKEKLFDLGLIKDKNSKVKLIMSNVSLPKISFKFEVDLYSKQAQAFKVV